LHVFTSGFLRFPRPTCVYATHEQHFDGLYHCANQSSTGLSTSVKEVIRIAIFRVSAFCQVVQKK